MPVPADDRRQPGVHGDPGGDGSVRIAAVGFHDDRRSLHVAPEPVDGPQVVSGPDDDPFTLIVGIAILDITQEFRTVQRSWRFPVHADVPMGGRRRQGVEQGDEDQQAEGETPDGLQPRHAPDARPGPDDGRATGDAEQQPDLQVELEYGVHAADVAVQDDDLHQQRQAERGGYERQHNAARRRQPRPQGQQPGGQQQRQRQRSNPVAARDQKGSHDQQEEGR